MTMETIILRWILKVLHEPKYLMFWELWHHGLLRSCRIFSINVSMHFSSGTKTQAAKPPRPAEESTGTVCRPIANAQGQPSKLCS